MRFRALLLLGACCALPAAATAGVHVVVKNGRKVIVNDGVDSTPREALRQSDIWLAARVAIPSLYDDQIADAARANAIDPKFVKSVMLIESAFDPAAVSRKGAQGLMQLMPETASRYGVRNPFDPAENIAGGARYLAELLGRFGGDLSRSLAAYNAGENAVLRYGGVPPYQETRLYVRKGLTAYFGKAVIGGGFGRSEAETWAVRGRPVHVVRDGRNRPLLTTDLSSRRASKRS